MANSWFGPIANNGASALALCALLGSARLIACTVSSDFGFSLDEVNWFGNSVSFAFLPCSILVPVICTRYGIRLTVRTPQPDRSLWR
jgi:hypothetical protein